MADSTEPGTLYVVSTPIGNLEDVTLRALRILREAELVIAEDSRRTRRLLAHFEIDAASGPSLYQGVERERAEALVDLLRAGKTLALVSDAGTPLLSDPGFPLVRAAVEAGLLVVPIPGASALLAALVKSGLPVDRFAFDGSPPKKSGALSEYVDALKAERRTVVLYESPHRILKTLSAFAERLPARPLVLCRELTKLHEEALRGTAAELIAALEARGRVRGEFVLLVAGSDDEGAADGSGLSLKDHVQRLVDAGLSRKEALKETARQRGLPKREVYRQICIEPEKGA